MEIEVVGKEDIEKMTTVMNLVRRLRIKLKETSDSLCIRSRVGNGAAAVAGEADVVL